MQFEFATASRIIFGSGKLKTIGTLASDFGRSALILSGAPPDLDAKLLGLLNLEDVQATFVKVEGEPTIDKVCEVINSARREMPDMVVGIGGGSALDTAKAVASLATNPGDVTDYLEIIGSAKTLTKPSLPLIAIPTTAGTGSEVTRNAVIASTEHHIKVSLRSPFLLPRIALVDPELSISVPPSVTATTGLDALTQLIEAYTCSSPNPITDALCVEGIRRMSPSLFKAYDNGNDPAAREDMALAALFSGLALANAKLGAVHGFAGPIGGAISAPHGAICASLLANVMSVNIAAMRSREPGNPSLERFAEIGRLVCGELNAMAETAILWVENFTTHAEIKPLSFYGLSEQFFDPIIEQAKKSSSMKGNPIILSDIELRTILQMSL